MRLFLLPLLLISLCAQAQITPTINYRDYVKIYYLPNDIKIDTVYAQGGMASMYMRDSMLIIPGIDTLHIIEAWDLPDSFYKFHCNKIAITDTSNGITNYNVTTGIYVVLTPDWLKVDYPPLQLPGSNPNVRIEYWFTLWRQKSVSDGY